MTAQWTTFMQPDGREHLQVQVSSDSDWSLFECVARALETQLSGSWGNQVDGVDERYWDILVGEGKLTLHLQHYFGIVVYPGEGADANASSLDALNRTFCILRHS